MAAASPVLALRWRRETVPYVSAAGIEEAQRRSSQSARVRSDGGFVEQALRGRGDLE